MDKNNIIKDSKVEEGINSGSNIKKSNVEDSKIKGDNLIIDENKIIEERKERFFSFIKKKADWIYYIILAGIVALSVYIRTRNMSGLKDVTTGTWTLGPDLDPFLFLRWAKYIVENGKLMALDTMRYAPLGYETAGELPVVPYFIAWTYKFLHVLSGDVTVTYAAVIMPVIMFALTVIAFYFLVREFFWKGFKDKYIVNIIALVSCFFLSVLPSILPRTIAGIPEKESIAFLFMFLAFLFFIKAWNNKNLKISLIYSFIAAISTATMALTWGGYGYIFLIIGFSTLISFLIGKVNLNKIYIFATWLFASFIFMFFLTSRYTIKNLTTSTFTGSCLFVLGILVIHLFINKTKIKEYTTKRFSKVPPELVTLILGSAIIILLTSLVLGFDFIIGTIMEFKTNLIKPASSRLIQTVAENRQPYFNEWAGNFGPKLGKIPLFFSLFLVGSVVLFYDMLKKAKIKEKVSVTFAYIVLLICIIFSRYSGSSLLNGENGISLLMYFGGVIFFTIIALKTYVNAYKKETFDGFKKIDFGTILIFIFFILGIVSARGAVRLIMMLVPSTSALVGYLIGFCIYGVVKKDNLKDDTVKLVGMLIIAIIIIASIYSGFYFYKGSKAQAEVFYPTAYQNQWQEAMSWVRENTPKNAVFGHWWDYGYWLQSIGERATVLDGGNAISYWNHLMGRNVLTSPNDQDALEFLYTHNATHYLIDSTDIGKYGAYSYIGSDTSLDRRSYINTIIVNEQMTTETKEGITYYYNAGVPLDEDLIFEEDGKTEFFAKENSGIGGIILQQNNNGEIKQAKIVLMNEAGMQKEIKIKYVYYKGELKEFDEGIEAGIFLCDYIMQDEKGIGYIQKGAGFYLSERTVNSFLVRKYLFGEEGNFKLVYTGSNLIIKSLNAQGFDGEFAYYQGQFLGPIKIWEIDYPDNVNLVEEYLNREYPKELWVGN